MSLEPLTGFPSLSLNVIAASRAMLIPNQGLQFADFWSTSVNFRQKYFYWKLRHQTVHEDDAPKMFASMEERSSFCPGVWASRWAGHHVVTSI